MDLNLNDAKLLCTGEDRMSGDGTNKGQENVDGGAALEDTDQVKRQESPLKSNE